MLLIYGCPFKDESLSGFLFRVAKENLMDNVSWILENIESETKTSFKEYEINWLTGNEIRILSDFLRIDIEAATKMTFRHILNSLNLNYQSVSKNMWFNVKHTRYCPSCIKEKAFHRTTWSSTHTIFCTKHLNYLIEKCDECHRLITIKQLINGKCVCKREYKKIKSKQTKNEIVFQYQSLIDSSILKGSCDDNYFFSNDSSKFMQSIEFLGFWVSQLISKRNISHLYDGKAQDLNQLKSSKSINQSVSLYEFSYNIIKDWPNNFHTFLSLAENENTLKFRSFVQKIIPSLKNTILFEFSNELNNYIKRYKLNLNTPDELVRQDEISMYSTKYNGSILNSTFFNVHLVRFKNFVLKLIEKQHLLEWLVEYENCLTKEELRKKWGTSAVSTLSILNSNILEQTLSFQCGSVTSWLIPKKNIDLFMIRLLQGSVKFIKNQISLRNAFIWIDPKNADLLIKALLQQKIPYILNEKSFDKSILCKNSIYNYFKNEYIYSGLKMNFISMRKLIFILGVKRSDILYWIETNRFGSNIKFNDGVSFEDYEYFSSRYITSFELALQKEIKITQLLTKHRLGAIESISGPTIKDGNRLLFIR